MLKKIKLNELFKDVTSQALAIFDINIKDSDNNTLYEITGENFIRLMLTEYSEFYFVYNGNAPVWDSLAQPMSDFINTWNFFLLDNALNFQKILEAYNTTYKPLDNYNMTETHTVNSTWNENNTERGKESVETDIHTDTTDTINIDNNNPLTSTDYDTTYDDYTTERKTGKTVSNGTQTTRTKTADDVNGTSQNRTKTEKTFDNRGYNKNGTDSNTENTSRSGNIGVTTSQQMLKSEIDLRNFQITRYIIDLFVKQNLILCGGDYDS